MRRQAELRRAAEEKERQLLERAEKLKADHGQEIAGRVENQHGIDDTKVRDATVDIVVRKMAERKVDPKRLTPRAIEESAGEALAKEDAKAREEAKLEAAKVRQAELLAQEKAREDAARAVQEKERQARRNEPVPGAVERFNATLAESRAKHGEANVASIERAANSPGQRPNYTRYEGMQQEQTAMGSQSGASTSKQSEGKASQGEISDAKAERLSKLEATFKAAGERTTANQKGRTTGGNNGRSGP